MSEIIFPPSSPSPIGGSNKIIDLDEYKMRRQLVEASAERDEAIEAALASAEDAVLQYTGRDFSIEPMLNTKAYMYDGSGILETDDFVNLVTVSAEGTAFAATNVVPGPREGATFYWLDFTGVPRQSPAMGFTRNLDTIFARSEGRGRRYVEVHVTAEYGWPGGAPASVKQAVTWLVDEFFKKEGTQGDVQAEAIANLSYVYQRISEQNQLPPRVITLLDPYRRLAL